MYKLKIISTEENFTDWTWRVEVYRDAILVKIVDQMEKDSKR